MGFLLGFASLLVVPLSSAHCVDPLPGRCRHVPRHLNRTTYRDPRPLPEQITAEVVALSSLLKKGRSRGCSRKPPTQRGVTPATWTGGELGNTVPCQRGKAACRRRGRKRSPY